jgi:hypothetical protein
MSFRKLGGKFDSYQLVACECLFYATHNHITFKSMVPKSWSQDHLYRTIWALAEDANY